jgi:hypothetical protein
MLWLIAGAVIAVCVFLFVPGMWDFIVSVVQWLIQAVSGFINSNNASNLT